MSRAINLLFMQNKKEAEISMLPLLIVLFSIQAFNISSCFFYCNYIYYHML